MKALSSPSRRSLFSWPALLLTVSLFVFWKPPTNAQVSIMLTAAAEGDDALLFTHKRPPNSTGFLWYRGKEQNVSSHIVSLLLEPELYVFGPAYSRRETPFHNGSLLIENVTLEDAGYYTLEAVSQDSQKEIIFGWLHVYQPVRRPTLLIRRVAVIETMNAVIMTCDTNEISIQWLFNGMSLPLGKRKKLSENNTTLTIYPVKRKDSGNYQCKVSNPISRLKSAPLKMNVERVILP